MNQRMENLSLKAPQKLYQEAGGPPPLIQSAEPHSTGEALSV